MSQTSIPSTFRRTTFSEALFTPDTDSRLIEEARTRRPVFNAVCNTENWKAPVQALISGIPADRGLDLQRAVEAAVVFFTGSVATTRLLPENGAPTFGLVVRAAGYYAAVGA